MIDHAIHPVTGQPMKRGFRRVTLTYKGATATFKMPGWYSEGSDDGLHSKKDMKVSNLKLAELKAKAA